MLRDPKQLREAPQYAITALRGFTSAEESFDAALTFVPWCQEHLKVWSPAFAQIILDCASQIESLWTAAEGVPLRKQLRITDHRSKHGPRLSPQRVVFFGGSDATEVHPFSAWRGSHGPSPSWWSAYNKLKHDRFTNIDQATMSHALDALAGLLLAIIYSGVCDLALIATKMLDTSKHGYNPWAFTDSGLLRDLTFECHTIVESRLLAHPFGVFAYDTCNLSRWWESKSERFNIWWALNRDRFTVLPSADPGFDGRQA